MNLTTKSSTLVFFVNQKKVIDNQPNPEETLISYLRRKLLLTGTKLACGEGGCGACTVMVSRVVDRSTHAIEHLAVNACLAPLVSVHGAAVTTIEGISRGHKGLHPLQERLSKAHGSQCGFCTPGILMSAYAVLRSGNADLLTPGDFDHAMQGNLCRCTGYRPILQALRSFAPTKCCGNPENCQKQERTDGLSSQLFNFDEFLPYEGDQEPIFPNELQLEDKYDTEDLQFTSEELLWLRPTTLKRFLELKQLYPNARIVNGNTEIGIETHQRKKPFAVLIQATHVKELSGITVEESGLRIGAAATLTEILQLCKTIVNDKNVVERKKRVPRAFAEMLHWFAGPQIRNVSSIGGNIMTASPISDLNPLLMAIGATLQFQNLDEERKCVFNDSFFTGYRKTACKETEVLILVFVPFAREREFFYGFKQSRRREDDISIVNAGMRVLLCADKDVVEEACLVFGGLAAVTKTATLASSAIRGMTWDSSLFEKGADSLAKEFNLPANAPGGQVAYRQTLATSFFCRFFHLVLKDIQSSSSMTTDSSAIGWIEKGLSEGSHLFEVVADGQLKLDPVGRPVAHVSAVKQTSGEAVYIDDMPEFANELFMAPVFSKVANAAVKSINYEQALVMDGVVGVADHNDVQGSLNYSLVEEASDEFVFAKDRVRCVGDIVAVVVARERDIARKAAARVIVEYSDHVKPTITIKDAIEADSFFPDERRLVNGDVEKAFSEAAHIVEGEFYMGGQEHFYFEPYCCLIYPKEDGELEVFLSTQNPTYNQIMLAHILGVSQSRIAVRVKRLGGAFGGKETRPMLIAGPAAVCARKFNRPVRSVLDRDDDMMISGTRHPVYATYKLAADKGGRLIGFQMKAFMNGGYSIDMSAIVAECLVWKSLNAYNIHNVDLWARICKTNTPSNTAFRGFGAPQGMLLIEKALSELAEKMNLSQTLIREINFVKTGDVLPFDDVVLNCTIQRCWFECKHLSQYEEKLASVNKFNKTSKYKKRGVFMSPISYGIGFGQKFLHQAGALVNIYTDGSVLITHAGVEMGQGLHTKLIQVASRVLNIPMKTIFISETATDKVPNTTSSAASMTTDLNAPAVMDACQQLKDRLSHFMHTNPKGTWVDWVRNAYQEGVNLSAQGFFHGPEPFFSTETMKGHPFIYFVYGAACSEVEIDALTGDHVVRSVDIVIDLGATLNPAIDIGQIEGAFIQGYGLYTLEEQRYTPDGRLLSKGPGAYKIPGFGDIPEKLNVHLLRGTLCEYPRAVYSSKAVGEPPLCLAVSVFLALREAVLAGRKEFGAIIEPEKWNLLSPATSERLRMAVSDSISTKYQRTGDISESQTPWEVKLYD